MPQTHQVEGGCQPGRPAPHDGYSLSGGGQFLVDHLPVNLILFPQLIHGIGQITMDLSLRHRLIQHLTPAAHLAMEVADPAYRAGQRIIPQRELKGILPPLLLDQLDISGDVHMQRTAVFTQRHEE